MIQDKMITIIIPSRTIDYLLEECINKIRELYKDIKIIIVLDAIDKNSYLFSDICIKILKSNNPNMSAKRNIGVNNCDTEYIAFIDSDAYPAENWIENGIKYLEQNTEYSAVTGNQFNPHSDTFEQRCLRLVRFSPLFTHKEWCIVIDKNAKEQDVTEFMTSNVIMRKKDYTDIGGMNENIYLAEDNEFSLRLINNGYKIRFIPEIAVFHRESKLYPFLRKIYCMGYYYANIFIKRKICMCAGGGEFVKDLKEEIIQFLPLMGCIAFLAVWVVFYLLKINTNILLILPLLVFFLLIKEAYSLCNKLEEHKIKGFFLILFTSFAFCAVYVTGTFLGSINFPTKSIQKCYKHY